MNILRQERSVASIPHILLTGLPCVVAYHVSDWIAFFVETLVDAFFDDEEAELTERQVQVRNALNVM